MTESFSEDAVEAAAEKYADTRYPDNFTKWVPASLGFINGYHAALRSELMKAMASAIEEFDEACTVTAPGQEKTEAWKMRWESARTGLTAAAFAYREATKPSEGGEK